ncbi:MAG: LPXTG cell wall anchor domain-containing protein, partial [Oscillospiraceae bacterium]|nr:LPXTG cell wall anchor domain-containing protein [Oscillospiraceae bacterium]
ADDGGGFVELGEDGTPLGAWHFDEALEAWIFDPIVPLGEPPATGDNGAALWMAIAVLAVFGAAAAGTRKRRIES